MDLPWLYRAVCRNQSSSSDRKRWASRKSGGLVQVEGKKQKGNARLKLIK